MKPPLGSIQNDKRPRYTFCDKPYFLSGRLTKQKRSMLIQFWTVLVQACMTTFWKNLFGQKKLFVPMFYSWISQHLCICSIVQSQTPFQNSLLKITNCVRRENCSSDLSKPLWFLYPKPWSICQKSSGFLYDSLFIVFYNFRKSPRTFLLPLDEGRL